MQMNKNLGLFAFLRNISFHGVCVDLISQIGLQLKPSHMRRLTKLLNDGIKNNVVQPIERTIFNDK